MKQLLARIRKILHDRRTRQLLTRIVSGMAAVVVFVTTYALVLPAITMESQAACGIEAHQHDDGCYEDQLVCDIPESPGHHHTDACYEIKKALKCGETEHRHGESCFDEAGNLLCTLPEHVHASGCYAEEKALVCTLPESDGHQHSAACYKSVLTCAKEVHTHSAACYSKGSGLSTSAAAGITAVATTDAGTTGAMVSASADAEGAFNNDSTGSAADEQAAEGFSSSNRDQQADDSDTADQAATDGEGKADITSGTSTDEAAKAVDNAPKDTYVPQLDALNFSQLLTKDTGIYYSSRSQENGDSGETPGSSAEITDWKRVDDDTVLAPTDLLRVYLRYTIPAGSLNTTNEVARYRLPSNLHLSDRQMETINATVNGIAAQYMSLDTLEITDPDKYNHYLGVEAVEGTRTPADTLDGYYKDHPELGDQEFINAVVKAENAVDEITGEVTGQDLVFTFTPYTIQKNQHEYDAEGQPLKAGETIDGWFSCDFQVSQVDWEKTQLDETIEADDEENADKNLEKRHEKNAEIVFVSEDDAAGTGKISEKLTLAEQEGAEDSVSDAVEKTTDAAAASGTDDTTNSESKEDGDQYRPGTLKAAGSDYSITLEYTADACIPDNAKLKVSEITAQSDPEAYKTCLEQARASVSEKDTDNKSTVDEAASRFFDIEIIATDENGEARKIEPRAAVSVNIQLEKPAEKTKDAESSSAASRDPAVLHFAEDGVENIENVDSRKNSQNTTTDIQFEAESFSVYGVVYVQLEKTIISAGGETYEIAVSYDADAQIPESAELRVAEILPEEEKYSEYYQKAAELVCTDESKTYHGYGRLFDISIWDGNKEIEPENTVQVSIRLTDAPESGDDLKIVHFGEKNPEVMEIKEDETSEKEAEGKQESPEAVKGTELRFETDAFSMYAVISSNSNNGLGLGGQKFAIVNANNDRIEAVLGRSQENNTALAASEVTLQNIDGKSYVVGDEVTVWEFVNVYDNVYNIKAPDGRYMNIGNQTASLSNTPQNITVTQSGNGLRLDNGGYGLNAWNRKVSEGFRAGIYIDDASRFTLYGVNELIQNQADKISLAGLINLHDGETPVEEVVIYTRILNRERDGYDYYAVAADGSLIPVYDIGDTVGWVSSNDTPEHLKWKLTVHASGGEHNGYFDFQSMETGKYLIPTAEGGLKEDDPADSWDLGVNMQGWSDHTYGSAIERWDTGAREYVGYGYDAVNNKIVPTEDDSQKLEFLFAHVKADTHPNQLHTVDTLDGKTKGITIRMYDFSGTLASGTDHNRPRSAEMTNVMGWNSIGSTNVDGVGYANRGLVSQTLTNGFPTATLTSQSLSNLFNGAHYKSDASNIFVKQVYDETGYFSYDSSKNYAYLDQEQNKFILYRELAAPVMEAKNKTPSGQKGNFFPFDSLQELANQNKVFTDGIAVKYDGDLQKMSPDNPQYGEKLYKIDEGYTNNYKSYFFGMTMEAQFYQGPDGKDENGNDIIYEFNGDDDMWLYIDDRLVLDIGGCHGAVSGTINFSTGEVRVNGAQDQVHTTLRQIFQSARKLPDGTNWTAEGAEKWFKGDTFADYTKHSFKMFYMERGSYASNLKMNFNLLTIEPGSMVLEKKLPDTVQSAYGDQQFAYQIYTVESNGHETLYTPPTNRYVTYEKSGDRVLPDGATESRGFKPEYTVNGQTYRNVYFLKAGESIVIPMENNEVRYFVREIGIDPLYEEVKANGRELTITKDGDSRIAKTTTDVVKTRGRVTYENIPKEVHSLRLEKKILGPLRNPGDSFRFDVQLEDAKTGKLTPFNQGKYYIVKTDENGVDQYYKYENGQLVQSETPVVYKAGISGSIDHILPGYTILITGLLPGTDFKVIENQSEQEFPEGYAYVKTEVDHAGKPEFEESQGTILSKVDGGGNIQENSLDAHVKITNTSDIKTDISVQKNWTGDMPAGKSTIVLYKVTGRADAPESGKPSSKVRIFIQADPVPVTTDEGYIEVTYTGTRNDGVTEDTGSFKLNNAEGWSKAFEFDRGGEYSFSYKADGTKVTSVEPDKTGAFTQPDTITLTTETAELHKYTYTFTVPEGQRPQRGSLNITFNGASKTADNKNNWTVSFEAVEGSAVSYSVQPDGKFISGVEMNPETASPAVGNVDVKMTPTVEALTMVVPISVDWSQSTTTLPADTQVTFRFSAQGREDKSVVLNSSDWDTEITLDRLDENGNLITYAVQAVVSTSDTNKTLTLENVPVSIVNSADIAAKGTVKSKERVRVTVQHVQYWSLSGYNILDTLPVQEFEPGDTITVRLKRENNPLLVVTYRTSDGQWGPVPSTHNTGNYDKYEETFDITLPDVSGDYTIIIDDPWRDGVQLLSAVKKAGATAFSVQSAKRSVRKAAPKSVPTHIVSPEQTFYDPDEAVGGSGDKPFKTILYKDLPAGAVEVETVVLDGEATKKWEGLSTIDENGNPIYYYVVERDAVTTADDMEVTYKYTYREDGTIEKVEITNNATGRTEPDTKDFSFTKVWRDPMGSATISWPEDLSVTVNILQKAEDNESVSYASYMIAYSDLTAGSEISAIGDTQGVKQKLKVVSSETSGYAFQLDGLPYEYTYFVSEETAEACQPPKYFGVDGNQVMGATQIGDGGTIYNDLVGYELPSTGGRGTRIYMILGSLLVLAAGVLLLRERKRI